MIRLAAVLSFAMLSHLALPAQSSGFREGELFLYSTGVNAPGYVGAGILRVDPQAGTGSLFVPTLGGYSANYVGGMVFDSYRQRLVFSSAIGSPYEHLWFADGQGNVQNVTDGLFPSGVAMVALAPTGDGRIYCTQGYGAFEPLQWFDAQNGLHVLYASDGVTPMRIDGTSNYHIDGMIYDPGTNALFVASTSPAPGFPQAATNIRKLPLSADGTRVVGPVGNVQFEISPNPPAASSGEAPRGWSRGPNGQLALLVHSIDTEVMPRMLLVDPATMAVSVFASCGQSQQPGGWATTTGGVYHPQLGRFVLVDFWNGVVRSYQQGGTGNGTVVPIGPVATTGYWVNLAVVPDDGCTGNGSEYGSGLAGAGGFVPHLASSGCPDVGRTVTVQLDRAVGGTFGILLLGSAQAAVPAFGGTLLLAPIDATLLFACSGGLGTPGAGTFALPLPLTNPALTGVSLFLQVGLLDAAAGQGLSISNGLRLVIG